MKTKLLPLYAKNLRKLVRDSEMTQAQVARASGVPRSIVSRCYNGIFLPAPHNLQAISDALGVQPSEISGIAVPDADDGPTAGRKLPREWTISPARSRMKDQVHIHVSMEVPMSVALKMLELLQMNNSSEEPGS